MARGTARQVTVIKPTKNVNTHLPTSGVKKRRVAAYARVSTNNDEQLTSYEAQIAYYTKYIKSNPNWKFVDVYTDEGISGTSTKKRDGFNLMIDDALSGKIDLIVTKSVSRFARNTVDTLENIRKLKDAGCECYFEKENIYTFDSKGELLITIMASLAQEESRSISENVTWGIRQRFSEGLFSLPYNSFLGYEKGEDGFPKVVPEEAEVVRKIYGYYMSGMGCGKIAHILTESKIKSPRGKDKWSPSTIERIIRNEKYKGSAILQKTYTDSFLNKKIKVNKGEVSQYMIDNSHEAIIKPEEWEAVQLEIQKRTRGRKHINGDSVLSGKIFCSDCGNCYGPKTWHSNSKYKKVIWQCNKKFTNEKKCSTPNLSEEEIEEKFVEAFNQILEDKEAILDDCRLMMNTLCNTTKIDSDLEKAYKEVEEIHNLVEALVNSNASEVLDQDKFEKAYNSYQEQYNNLCEKIDSLENKKKERIAKSNAISKMMFEMREYDEYLQNFDGRLFLATVEKVTVNKNGSLLFLFENGIKIKI